MSSPAVDIVATTPTERVEFLIPNSNFKVSISQHVAYVEDLSKTYTEQIVVKVWWPE